MSDLSLNAETLYSDLLGAMRPLIASYAAEPRLVGIASGGAWLAERLHADLGLQGKPGTLSSSMHRDDFAKRGLASGGQTMLPFDVKGAHLIVVDDVLFTGRTMRAVLNELFDYGRPAGVKLVVLVDRGVASCRLRLIWRWPASRCPHRKALRLPGLTTASSALKCKATEKYATQIHNQEQGSKTCCTDEIRSSIPTAS